MSSKACFFVLSWLHSNDQLRCAKSFATADIQTNIEVFEESIQTTQQQHRLATLDTFLHCLCLRAVTLVIVIMSTLLCTQDM